MVRPKAAIRPNHWQYSNFLVNPGHWRAVNNAGTRRALCRGMTHRNVETLIGRLATDSVFRRRFVADPTAVLGELRAQGYELTLVELDALASTSAGAIESFADSLDRRICRADVRPAADPGCPDQNEQLTINRRNAV